MASARPGVPSSDGVTTYTLDGMHNRLEVSVVGADHAGAAVGEYELVSDGANGVFHAELNQYTVTPRLDGDAFDFESSYDANGNLTLVMEYPRTADMDGNYVVDMGDLQIFLAAFQAEDPIADLNGDGVFDQDDLTLFTTAFTNAPAGGFYHAMVKYDERNQLVGFEARRGGTLLKKSSYRYDAFNRRVASFADTDGDGNDDVVTYQVYGGQAAWQLLAEYDGADDAANLLRSYVYGLYIDEVLSMRDHASDDDYFYHQDDLFSVYALTDADGVVVERYDYGDYGQVSIMEANGTPRAASAYDNRHTFTGRLLMPELTLDDGGQILEYRHRYMLASNGRFVQRDPLGYVGCMSLYAYVCSMPVRYFDPSGRVPLDPVPHKMPPANLWPAEIDQWRPPSFELPSWVPKVFPEDFRGPGKFKWKGNYGGPKWSCGRWMEDGERPPSWGEDGYVLPEDDEDACYEQHDRDTYACRNKSTKYQQCVCTKSADSALINCLEGIPTRTGSIRSAIWAFKLKIANTNCGHPPRQSPPPSFPPPPPGPPNILL